MRGLRRLLGRIELPVRRAEGNAVRPQATNRPEQLQQGLLLPERVLPELRHGRRRRRTYRHPGADHEAAFNTFEKALVDPQIPRIDACYDLLVTGVGGTGVITVGALVTMAAHLEGKGASELDFMGFAQKFGPVLSYLRLANDPAHINQVRIEPAQADALIGCDIVVSSSPKASVTYQKNHTRAVVNTAEMLTGDFIRHRDASLRRDDRVAAIADALGEDNLATLNANLLAEQLMGDTIYANVLLLGAAWQHGLVPVSLEALLRAIELNGVKIEENKRAFTWGRIAASAAEPLHQLVNDGSQPECETLDTIIERRREFLVDYQGEKLAQRYLALLERLSAAAARVSNDDALSVAAAKSYFKLLSYKDEYEVARLHTQTTFLDSLRANFGENAKPRFHMAPPILSSGVDARGRPRKREFGPWILPALRLLAALRKLRGTPLDVFGYTRERRMERGLIAEFEATIDTVIAKLRSDNIGVATNVLCHYLDIRGYGPRQREIRRRGPRTSRRGPARARGKTATIRRLGR